VVGDGPDRQALIKLSKRLNIADRVIFLSYVKNPGEILTKADIFVMASHAEPFGLATADAREAGCAIVGTSVGGTPELLDFGKASVLVKPESPERDRSSTRQADVGFRRLEPARKVVRSIIGRPGLLKTTPKCTHRCCPARILHNHHSDPVHSKLQRCAVITYGSCDYP